MTTYTVLADGTLAQDKPLTQSVTRAFRDNPLAIAEGTANSPAIRGVNPALVTTVSTAVASITFSNLAAADLIDFELLGLRPATNGAVLHAQVSINNGSSWVTNYIYAKTISEISTANTPVSPVSEGGYTTSEIKISKDSGGVQNSGSLGLNGVFSLFNNGSTAYLKCTTWRITHQNNSTSGTVIVSGGGHISGVSSGDAINAIKFFFSSGNIAGGQITVRPKRTGVAN